MGERGAGPRKRSTGGSWHRAAVLLPLVITLSSPLTAQLLPQETTEIDGNLGASSDFGRAFAAGDFDGDGLEDLAIGAPGTDNVIVLFGPWPGSGRVRIESGTGRFGRALVACDFNGDGYDDLAVGEPDYESAPGVESGRVRILRGALWSSADLLSEVATLDEVAAGATLVDGDDFGFSMAAGRFGFAFCGLAVGVPGKEIAGHSSAGAVRVFENEGSFVFSLHDSFDTTEVGGAEAGEAFGSAVATPAEDSSFVVPQPRLAVSAPFRTVDGVAGAGMVVIYTGSGSLSPFEEYTEPSLRPGSVPTFSFGQALAFGNFDGNQRPELVIGAPYAPRSDVDATQVGAVHVVELRSGEPSEVFTITQDSPGVPSATEPFDLFGASLAVGNFNGDPFDDLAVGAPFENSSDGQVFLLYGAALGLATAEDSEDLFETDVGGSLSGERFGEVLATGDLDADGADDLAVGMPLRDDGGAVNEGLVYLVPSEAQLTGATLLLREGQELAQARGSSTVVVSIPKIAHDEEGRLGLQTHLSGGTWVIVAESAGAGWQVLFDSAAPSAAAFESDLEELALGIGDRFLFTVFDNDQAGYVLWSDAGQLALEGSSIPGTSASFGEPEHAELFGGLATFTANASQPDYLLRDDGSGSVSVLSDSFSLPNVGQMREFNDLEIGGDGSIGWIGTDVATSERVALIGGVEIAREGSARQLDGFDWERISQIDLADSSRWALRGELLDGSSTPRILRPGEPWLVPGAEVIDGTLVDHRPLDMTVNHAGHLLSVWTGGDPSANVAVLSCAGRPSWEILRGGDWLDFDGDGLRDAQVTGSIAIGDASPDAGTDVLVELKEGALRYDAVLRLNAACPLFADDFESGDFEAWSSAVP